MIALAFVSVVPLLPEEGTLIGFVYASRVVLCCGGEANSTREGDQGGVLVCWCVGVLAFVYVPVCLFRCLLRCLLRRDAICDRKQLSPFMSDECRNDSPGHSPGVSHK